MTTPEELIGETRRRILDLLRRSRLTIGELADELGISGTAVRAHVAGLQRDGLVEESGRAASTGGKPARLYDLTPEAEELYPKAYALVLGEVVRALEDRDGRRPTLELLRSVGARAAQDAEEGLHGAESRVAAAADLLRSMGGEVTVGRVEDGWEIRGLGCPLSAVVVREPGACAVAQGLLAAVTGLSVVECCDRSTARPRCAFTIREAC